MQKLEMERLAERVRASARDGGLIETAQVKLVGLDEVRQAAGPRWPRMREYVREGSIKIIAERIGAEDAVVACGDGFLIVFADASTEQSQAKCAEIRDALIGFYLGEETLALLRADVTRQTTSAASLAGMVAQSTAKHEIARQRSKLTLGRFWPVWSTPRRGIAAHLCAPAIEERNGAFRIGYTREFLEKPAHKRIDLLDLDLCLLEQACSACERPGAGPVGVSVHSTTLQNKRARRVYLDHVATNAGTIRHRMFVTIAEIEPGAPLISLTEWTSALMRTFSRVALDLHHSDRALASIASTGVWAAGYHLPAAHAASTLEVRLALSMLETWCRTLRRQNILPFMSGFANASVLDLATYSDLAFATGDALWPSSSEAAIVDHISLAEDTRKLSGGPLSAA